MIPLSSTRQRVARLPFLFRAHDCLDEVGMFALSFGQKVYATFSRAGRGLVIDQAGRLVRTANDAPRISHLFTGGARVPALVLEGAVGNLCARSEDFADAVWSKSNVTVTANATIAPDGTLTGDLLTASATAGLVSQTIVFTTNSRKSAKIFVKEFSSSAQPEIGIYDGTAAVSRHRVRMQWVAGVPVLTTVDGGGFVFTPRPADFGWWEIDVAADGVVAANTNSLILYPDRDVGTGGTYMWGAQAENAGTLGSYVRTAGVGASQQAEVCSFPFRMRPAALSAYYAGIEIGLRVQAQLSATSYDLCVISNAAAANPKLRMNCFSGNGRYQFQRTLASGTQITGGIADAAQPDPWEAFELRGRLYTAGNVDVGMRTAGDGVEATGGDATTAALESAWGGEVLYFNQLGETAQRFRTATRALAFADGAMGMDELAALCEVG